MNQFNDNVMTKITKRYGKKKTEPELKEMGFKKPLKKLNASIKNKGR